MQKIFFPAGNETIAGNLLIARENAPGMLVLHGGGSGNKERFAPVQQALFEKGISSLAIDFRGVGESSGKFENGSLQNRLVDAQAAVWELKKYTNRVGVFGSSMGGFVAAMLADSSIKLIVLASAAAYSRESEDKTLNEQFTQEIRKEHSWENSRSFDTLAKWNGKLLVVYGEFDTKIPDEIKESYKKIAEKLHGKYVVIPDTEHSLLAPASESGKQAIPKALEIISTFVKENL